MPDSTAFRIVEGRLDCGLIFLCDHASNAVPEPYGSLGLPREQLERHIGYDIGAAAVTEELARAFGAPAILTTFSRLLIDPNRGEDDPTLVMKLSDGAVVPGNAGIDAAERERRLERYYRPYHRAIAETIARAACCGTPPVLISIHSFTECWRGRSRPWHVGCLWDRDDRAARRFMQALAGETDIIVGDNEPYDGALENDSMYRHGTALGLAHVLIELRQDLIRGDAAARGWAQRLVPALQAVNADPDCHVVRFYGSRADLVETSRREPA